MALVAVVLVLELTRRFTGWLIPVIAIFAIAYVLYLGPLLSGLFFFGGLSEYRMAYRMFWQDGALLGSTVTISATIIFMFVLLSTLMRFAGATQFIINGTLRLMHRIPGGSAHVAVLSSALMGTVSGSAVANVAGTGTITIPMMKRAGLNRELAGGVEAAASTGSQLVPPIMGAGIFIMSDWIGIPYSELVLYAIIPAILYFLSISFNIHLELKKAGLLDTGIESNELPKVGLGEAIAFTAPIVILIALLTIGYSPVFAAAWTCLAMLISSFLTPHPLWPARWLDVAKETLQTLIPTAIVLVCAGIIVVCVETSGLVVAMAQSLTLLGQGNLMLVLALIAVISLFLGMGLPVTASYIVVASFAAAALTSLGVSPVAAHMAIFWLSQDSLLTPPVCLAAYAAAGISGGNPAQTGVRAMLLGKGLYLMPILFVFHGLLFDQGTTAALVATCFGAATIIVFAMASVGQGPTALSRVERVCLLCAAILLLWPDIRVQVLGLCVAIIAITPSYLRSRSNPASKPTQTEDT
ncbi:MAG: TRAP transporter fused permease subunit [Pseudomonadota bacterium]